MRGEKIKRRCTVSFLLLAIFLVCTGCGGSLNTQLSEILGTQGKYENDVPVQTPKMQAESQLAQKEADDEATLCDQLKRAQSAAVQYDYAKAVEIVESVDEKYQEDDRVSEALIEYRTNLHNLTSYIGVIPHFAIPALIVDTDRAFDGDEKDEIYRSNMLTVKEFQSILEQLYANDYVLVDLQRLAQEGTRTDKEGNEVPTWIILCPQLPEGKKPFVMSFDEVNYDTSRLEDGFAQKLLVDTDGSVKASYTDSSGNISVGAYDGIPILECFIDAHPDFSYRGSRGLIGLNGYKGAFGYPLDETNAASYAEDCQSVSALAANLKADGWTFASDSYTPLHMSQVSFTDMQNDFLQWQSKIGTLVGEVSILIYPYGDEVTQDEERRTWLEQQGIHFFCGLWNSSEYFTTGDTYAAQTRRCLNGYTLQNEKQSLSTFFNADQVYDEARNKK